jgi:signal transduction histidine kinase
MANEPNLLEQLLDGSNQMIQVSDLETYSMLYANKPARVYTDHADQPYEGMHCYEYMMGLHEQCPFCPMRKIGEQESFEAEVDNGREVYAVKTQRTKWNGKDAFIEYAWDVTEIRRSEKIYEEQIRTLISAIPEAQGIFHMDVTGDRVLSINGSSKEVLTMGGLKTVDDLVHMVASYVPEGKQPEEFFSFFCRQSMLNAYENGKTELMRETMSYFDDKSIRPARITARLIINPSSNHLECILYGMDISGEWNERRERERLSREQLAVFNTLARNFMNVFRIDLKDGTAEILKMEAHFSDELENRRFFPYPDVLNSYVAERVHPDDREMLYNAICMEHLREIFAQQDEYIGNYRILVDGQVHCFQFNLSRMEGTENIICGFQNIDSIIEEHLAAEKREKEKEQRYQDELRKAAEKARSANSAKTEFLLRMSHDVRTPLNGIIGMLDIADRYSTDIAKQNECREKVRNSSKILLELVNEVLDMSKLDSGEVTLEHVPFNLADVSKDVFSVIKKQADERGIEIVQRDCAVEHYDLLGSPTHYKRLMMNIVSNAVKYNKEYGKIYITCKEIACENNTATILFRCRDTGVGMSKEFMEHIFDPFAQEDSSVRSQFGGTGLGMSIAKKLAEKMGGTISVDSVKGEGSTFDVVIPFEIDTAAHSERTNESTVAPASIDGMKILLVEDVEINMEIAQFLLEEAGAIVVTARNGQEAVKAFSQSARGDFDVILMDLMMPVMDGYSATRHIRGLDRWDAARIPIIAMTANAFAEDKIAVREAGMNEHISKPLDTKQMIQTIARLASAYRAQK